LRKKVLLYLFCRHTRNRIHSPKVFSICLNLPAALDLAIYSASNRNKYPKQNIYIYIYIYIRSIERGRRLRLSTSPPSVSRYSEQCDIFNISQSYRPPRPVRKITSLFCFSFMPLCGSNNDNLATTNFLKIFPLLEYNSSTS
jgi:hypothetical protein